MSGYALPPPPPSPTPETIASEVNAELAAQTGPLETLATGYGQAEDRAVGQLQQLYGGIMPFVEASAKRVAEAYGASTAAQQSIFNEAFTRLNSLRSQRASEAQALAQQLGAPVPLDMFTDAIDTEISAAVPEGAGAMLKAHGLAQAGVQHAEAFAGKVMPLHRVRLEQETHNYFRDKIWELKQQIAQIQGQSGAMISERLRARQLEDYQMKLDRTQIEYDRWKTQQGIKMDKQQLKLQQKQDARAAKKDKQDWWLSRQSVKLERQRFNAEKLQFAQQMGLSVAELNANIASDKRSAGKTSQFKQQEYIIGKKEQIVAISDTILTSVAPKYKTIKVKDVNGNGVIKTVVDEPGSPGMGGAGPMKVLRTILAKGGVSKNQKVLYNFAIAQVIRSYEAAGYTGIPKDPSKWKAWWQRRTAPGAPPLRDQPPAPPGSTEWVWNPKTKKYEKRKH
jgi:hypothetical protein